MAGELSTDQNIAVLNSTMQQLNATLNDLRSDLKDNYLPREVYASDQKAVWANIKSHQSWLVWAQRLALGAVFLAVLAVVLKTNGSL